MTVYGQALELTADELTMTEEEAKAVLALGKRGRADQAMIERAQGWPAVIGLAAMTKEKHLPADALVPRALHDFLASELLDAAPSEVQEALLVLAAASVGTLDVAQLLLGDAWKPAVEGAAKQRLILSGSQGDLAVHPLLRELLIEQLKDPTRRDAVVSKLRPLIDNRRWDEALSAAEVIPEGRYVTAALTEALEDLLHSGRSETLSRWAAVGKTAGVPVELVEYIEGELALRDANFDKSLLLCSRAAARLHGELAAKAHLCAARAAHLAEQPVKAGEHARSAQELATTARTRLNALWARFTQAADAEALDLDGAFNEFASSSDSSYETQFRLAGGRMIISQTRGDFATALDEGRVTSSLAGRGADPVVETAFFSVYADTLGIRARYREALDATSSALQMAQEYGLDFVRHYVLPQKIRALIGLRRFAEADRHLKELARILKGQPDAYLAVHNANQRAGLLLSMGHPERALEAIATEPVNCSAAGQRGERLGLRAFALATLGRHAEALDQARAAERTSRLREVCVLVSLAKALVALANSDDASAHEAMEQAIAAGAYHQLILGLRAAPDLVSLAAQGAENRSFLTHLFVGSNDSALAHRAGLEVPRSALRTDRLSPRELEIHGLIAQGLTNREIARILFISPSTAKVHVHHVLEKLGVRTRIEAARLWEAPEGD